MEVGKEDLGPAEATLGPMKVTAASKIRCTTPAGDIPGRKGPLLAPDLRAEEEDHGFLP